MASFDNLGYDVVEMVLADQGGLGPLRSREVAHVRRWLEENPDDDTWPRGSK